MHVRPFCIWLSALLLLSLFSMLAAHPANAQTPQRQSMPNDTLVSPETLADQRVTFRIYAPKATEVVVLGNWGVSGIDPRLTKDAQGVWSITVGPLIPDIYSYAFSVDGVRTLDPKNPMVTQGISSVDNLFFLPGREAAFEDQKTVPHGEIRKVWYSSSTLHRERGMHVYFPPGYEGSRERYPVLYLLHGRGDDDSGWSTVGRAGFILDNLLAEKKARPMIVVMPNGSLPRPNDLPTATPGSPPPGPRWLHDELVNDIVPYVEKHYRVRTGPENRALAGLSIGGGQTLGVMFYYPDRFGYVAIWSAGIEGDPKAWEQMNAELLDRAKTLNQHVKLLSISVGDKDFTYSESKAFSETLTRHGIKHEFHVSGGGHSWTNWRHYLNDFAPFLFRNWDEARARREQ